MASRLLKDRCKTNTNIDTDTFVGIKSIDGDITVSFPLGFRLEETDKALRKDILLLLSTLSRHTDKSDSELNNRSSFNEVDMPLQAYLYVIADYYSRGYYKETETVNAVAKKGKIDWGKTIKTQKAYIQGDEVYYLDFVTKRRNVNENELITQIHKYCVYESFMKVGWLFTEAMPEKPQIIFNKKLFAKAVRKKESETFNDRNKKLFRNMHAIIVSLGDDGSATDFTYGTNRFEYVWESMIDKAYGIKSKEQYFPKTRWLLGNKEHRNASLEPDTIMVTNNKVYVLDAKYYKYGWSGASAHLPESTSINKQITYGEYIAESEKFLDAKGNHPIVYNAFIMPYDAFGKTFHTERDTHFIGVADSDWKTNGDTKTYEKIAGILLDVKTIMNQSFSDRDKITELAELIETSIEKYC